ncbi:unnamed protein product, partial [Nesidiocoris tenuis]
RSGCRRCAHRTNFHSMVYTSIFMKITPLNPHEYGRIRTSGGSGLREDRGRAPGDMLLFENPKFHMQSSLLIPRPTSYKNFYFSCSCAFDLLAILQSYFLLLVAQPELKRYQQLACRRWPVVSQNTAGHLRQVRYQEHVAVAQFWLVLSCLFAELAKLSQLTDFRNKYTYFQ